MRPFFFFFTIVAVHIGSAWYNFVIIYDLGMNDELTFCFCLFHLLTVRQDIREVLAARPVLDLAERPGRRANQGQIRQLSCKIR